MKVSTASSGIAKRVTPVDIDGGIFTRASCAIRCVFVPEAPYQRATGAIGARPAKMRVGSPRDGSARQKRNCDWDVRRKSVAASGV